MGWLRLTLLVCAAALVSCAGPALPPTASAGPRLALATDTAPRFVSPYAYEWFVRAELLRASGDAAGALQAYERVLSGDSDDAHVLARMAEMQIVLGRLDEAEASVSRALQVDPHDENAWLSRGALAERRGHQDEALAIYLGAARVAPSASQPIVELSRLLQVRGDQARAAALWRERPDALTATGAGSAQWELEQALTAGDAERIARALGARLRAHSVARSVLRRGLHALLDAGRAELAVPMLGALLPSGDDAELHLDVLLAAHEYDRAEQLLVSTPPDALGGPLRVAEAYLRLGQVARASERLEDVPQVPDDFRRMRIAGQIALAQGQCDQAAALLSDVPPASAEHAAARTELGAALSCAGLAALAAELPGD